MWDEEDFANFPDQDYRSGPMYPEEQGSPPSASSSGRNRSATSSTRSQLPRGQGNGNPQAAANHAEEPTVVYTLFVNHLTLNTCELEVEMLFKPFGALHSVFVHHSKQPKALKTTYGFVRFLDEESAIIAQKALHRTEFKGERLMVDFARHPKKVYGGRSPHRHQPPSDADSDSIDSVDSSQADSDNVWYLHQCYVQLLSALPRGHTMPTLATLMRRIECESYAPIPFQKEPNPVTHVDLDWIHDNYVQRLAEDLAEGQCLPEPTSHPELFSEEEESGSQDSPLGHRPRPRHCGGRDASNFH